MAELYTSVAPPRRARNLAEAVVRYVRDQLDSGALRPGDKLPTESQLMRALDVSRTVVREAISGMQAAKLIETRHGIGSFVLEPQPEHRGLDLAAATTLRDVLAILELRISIETESAGLAAQRAQPEDFARMRAALEAIEETRRTGADSVAADLQFHTAIARATGNRYFLEILTQMGNALIPRNRLDSAGLARTHPSEYISLVNLEHEGIVSAIERHDADAARAAMRMHLSNSRERLRRANDLTEKDGAGR